MNRLRWWLVSGAGIPRAPSIGAKDTNTDPTGQRAWRRPANFIVAGQFRTVKYRPDHPRRPFQNVEETCLWVCAFVDWYNHQHRHSGIRFVTPDQCHSGQAEEICRHRARL